MARRQGVSAERISGGGLPRLLLAYVATITVGAEVAAVIEGRSQGTDVLALVALMVPLLIPALALSIELVYHVQPDSRTARALLGVAAWGGYGGFLALVLSGISRVVLIPETVGIDLGLFAGSGAIFALLGFDGHSVRPRRALQLLALAVVVFVVLGSAWMAGRWGAAT